MPPVATTLSYSPIKCHGSTPSVQILSRGTAMVAKMTRDKSESKRRKANKDAGDDDGRGDDGGDDLVAKFAMMLRCSYVCSSVGVASVNYVPISIDKIAKKVRYASVFSN